MITQAKNFLNQAVHGYELQAIVGFNSPAPRWFEVLYRPVGSKQVEGIFKQMSNQEKIDFDIQLFSLIPSLQHKHKSINLSLNLSPLSLNNEEFLKCFKQLLTFQSIECCRLCIEVIETDILEQMSPEAIQLIKNFKSQGGQLALDDFGNGHTHWELLELELVDIIKVASQNINNKQERKIFSAMASFSKQLGLSSVMEGIETEDEYQFARKIGFDYCQGWLFNSWKQSI